MRERCAINATRSHRDDNRGQILPIFALMLVFLVAMVGLVIDGGSTFAQRRAEQNAADLAALAGANAWLVDTNMATRTGSAISAARAVAKQNGYEDGVGGQTVTVTTAVYGAGQSVKVDITAPHRNHFAAILPGQASWNVSTTATAAVGIAGGARGAAPVMFSALAFQGGLPGGTPLGVYDNPAAPFTFEGPKSNDSYPPNAAGTAWTVFGSNVNSAEVKDFIASIISGTAPQNGEFPFGTFIGLDISQQNSGYHTTLFSSNKCDKLPPTDLNCAFAGHDLAVPVVDTAGKFQGWAVFHLVSADGGSGKSIVGYFKSGFSDQFDICMDPGNCPNSYGAYALKLIN